MLKEFIRRICFTHLMMRTALVLDCIVVFIQLSGLLLLAAFNILSAQTVFFCIGGGGIIAIVGWLYW